MNEQQKFWAKDYAKEYMIKNHEFNLTLGVECWRKMLVSCDEDVTSILECGSNIGRNINFLNVLKPGATKSVIESSKPAFDFVPKNYKLPSAFNGSIEDSQLRGNFDLVFTVGVLIHIHPDHLLTNLSRMFDYSSKYLLIGKYFNRTPVMVEYQGQKERLFKRDFGRLFIEKFPVKLIDYGFLWGYVYDNARFDDITWWLFKE